MVLGFICALGFAHDFSSQTKGDQDGPVSVKYDLFFQSGDRVDVYANDKLIGSAERIDLQGFRFTWINVPEGQYTLKAVAMTEAELSGTSKPVLIKVEKPSRGSVY